MKRRAFLTVGIVSVASLSGCLGDTEYRVTEAVSDTSPEPLSISARTAVSEATIEHPAELVFSVENTSDEPVRIRSYGVWPFGVLSLTSSSTPGDDERRITLISPSYESTDRVQVSHGRSSISVDGTPITRTLNPGEQVSSRYEVHGDDLWRADTYFVVDNFERRAPMYSTNEEWMPFNNQIRITIDEKSRVS